MKEILFFEIINLVLVIFNSAYGQSIRINGQYSINYSLSCDILNSTQVKSNVKCFILGQMVKCKALFYNQMTATNSCLISTSSPSLIKYDKVQGLSLSYNLGIEFKSYFLSSLGKVNIY